MPAATPLPVSLAAALIMVVVRGSAHILGPLVACGENVDALQLYSLFYKGCRVPNNPWSVGDKPKKEDAIHDSSAGEDLVPQETSAKSPD